MLRFREEIRLAEPHGHSRYLRTQVAERLRTAEVGAVTLKPDVVQGSVRDPLGYFVHLGDR